MKTPVHISHPNHGFWNFMRDLAAILAQAAPAVAAIETTDPKTRAEVAIASEVAGAALDNYSHD